MRLLLRTRVQLTRRAVRQGCHFFVIPQRNGERKGTQGPNALGKPATRKRRYVSLCSYLREGKRLQLLRWRFKEKRQHGSRTQSRQQKFLPSATHSCSTKFQAKTILFSPPAARGSLWREMQKKMDMFFSSIWFEARHGVKRGEIACLHKEANLWICRRKVCR